MNQNRLTMKKRPKSERPYEKCLEHGPESLTDGELLAIILRSGTKSRSSLEVAWDILECHPIYKGLISLHHLDLKTLKQIPGVGDVKAIEILCVSELSKRLSRASVQLDRDFSSPEYIASYYMESMRHLDHEEVFLLLLNGQHRLIREIPLSSGTATSAVISIKQIFMEALRYGAVYIILIHNHPSGITTPSREDIVLTRKVKEAGQLLGIPLSDHIIIGNQCFLSLREEQFM